MARTIKEIANGMKASFIKNENLCTAFGLTYDENRDDEQCTAYYDSNFSAVSVETCLLYVVATCAAVVENMMDWFREDVSDMINRERYGHAGWYVKKALQFRYGTDINANYLAEPDADAVDGDFAESDVYPELDNDEELETLQVIKYAYCEDSNTGGLVLKIAGTDDNNELCPLSDTQLAAFTTYINRIKPAGIPITLINSSSDVLTLSLAVYYNPLVMNSSGELISESGSRVVKPVEDTIRQYLNGIDFNGEFVSMRLVDAIQAAEGVEIVELLGATQQHAGYAPESINTRYTPYSGYFTIDMENDCDISYIANI